MARKRTEKYITQRGKALYVNVKVTVKGKRQNISGGCFRFENYTTPGACWQAAIDSRDEIIQKARANILIIDEPTVEDLFNRRTDYISLSAESVRKHQIMYNNGMKHLGNKKISQVSAADIQKSLNQYGETHSTDGVKHLLSLWKQVYRTAAFEELPVPDKTLAVKVYESKVIKQKREKTVTYEDFQSFCDALAEYGTDNPRTRYRTEAIYYALQLQLYAGLRPQEAYALFREDIDLERGVLHIRRRCGSTASETRQIITLKTADSCADLPIAKELRPFLKEMLMTYHTDPLLADYDGLPFDNQTVPTIIHAVSEKSGIRFTQYMLRHLFAKEMSKIADIKTVQSLMRHANADMSLYYSWSTDEEMRDAIDKRRLS